MKKNSLSPFLFIIPLFILAWGFFYLSFYDPFHAHASDPEYCYLLNGLNVSLLEFNRIGHTDHPGTPFQLYSGLIMRITHVFTGKDSMAQDVFNRPEYYLSAISFSLVILQALLCFLIAWIGRKREITVWKLIVLQSGILFGVTMLSVFARIIPERWLVMVSLLFIIVYLLYGYKDRHPLKFAIWSGVIMGMGMATKFNFLPIIFLPFLLLNSKKDRFIYATSGVVSFFLFLLPVINKFGNYGSFIFGIATHDGMHGTGEKRMFDPVSVKSGFLEIFEVTPALALVLTIIVAAIGIALFYRRKQEMNRQILFFTGMIFIVLLQMLMVAKHFKYYYIHPLITMYPIILFVFDEFIQKIGNYKRWTLLPVILLFIVFTCSTAKIINGRLQYEKVSKAQREIEQQFVKSNLPKNSLWFSGYPSWRCASYEEAGIMYGLTRKITLAVARIKNGKQKKLYLGNLNAMRDWGYAKDYVECMWRILQHKEPEDFVIATGEMHSVREFCTLAFAEAGINLRWEGENENEKGIDEKTGCVLVEVDSKYYRPTEVDQLLGDPSKAKKLLGWNPTTTPFEKLVKLMVQNDLKNSL